MEVQGPETEFMRLFIKSLIVHSVPLEDKSRLVKVQDKLFSFQQERDFKIAESTQVAQQVQEIIPEKNLLQKTIMAKDARTPSDLPYPFVLPFRPKGSLNKTQQLSMPIQRIRFGTTGISTSSIPANAPKIPKPSLSRPSNLQKIDINSLIKLDSLLNDIAVQTIECPGPGKQIIVYKSGVIQTTNLSLTSDEINNIMKEISEKTRIPIVSGTFKAAFGDVITTAVISDFVGTRFILQKKTAIQ